MRHTKEAYHMAKEAYHMAKETFRSRIAEDERRRHGGQDRASHNAVSMRRAIEFPRFLRRGALWKIDNHLMYSHAQCHHSEVSDNVYRHVYMLYMYT